MRHGTTLMSHGAVASTAQLLPYVIWCFAGSCFRLGWAGF